jgi:hypothetical protein
MVLNSVTNAVTEFSDAQAGTTDRETLWDFRYWWLWGGLILSIIGIVITYLLSRNGADLPQNIYFIVVGVSYCIITIMVISMRISASFAMARQKRLFGDLKNEGHPLTRPFNSWQNYRSAKTGTNVEKRAAARKLNGKLNRESRTLTTLESRGSNGGGSLTGSIIGSFLGQIVKKKN